MLEGCKSSAPNIKRAGREVARMSYCSFRKFTRVKRISAQLGGVAAPFPPPPKLMTAP